MLIKLSESQKTTASSFHVFHILKCYFKALDRVDQDKEHFFVFHLTARNKIKMVELISLGTLNSTVVHPREIFTRAIAKRSSSIVVAHNHPSGDVEPSVDDITSTNRIQEASRIIGIELIDHVVVSLNTYYSFKEHKLL